MTSVIITDAIPATMTEALITQGMKGILGVSLVSGMLLLRLGASGAKTVLGVMKRV